MNGVDTHAMELGVETSIRHLSKIYHTGPLSDLLQTAYEETGENSDKYRSKSEIRDKSGVNYGTAVRALQDDDNYFIGCKDDDFEPITYTGAVNMWPHLPNGDSYRISGEADSRAWLEENGDLKAGQPPIGAPDSDGDHDSLRARLSRFGWNLQSLTQPDIFDRIENEIPSAYSKSSPLEVETAFQLEINSMWPIRVDHESTFEKGGGKSNDDRHYVKHRIEVEIGKYDMTEIQELTEFDLEQLFNEMDTSLLARVVELFMPIFDEEDTSYECDCDTPREHMLRASGSQRNFRSLPINKQVGRDAETIREQFSAGEVDAEEICLKAQRDDFGWVERGVSPDKKTVSATYEGELNNIKYVSRGGRI